MSVHNIKTFLHVGVAEDNLGKTMVSGSSLGVGASWVTVSEVNVIFPMVREDLKSTAAHFLRGETNRLKNEHDKVVMGLNTAIVALEADSE